jgi:hypothetical protein
LTPGNVITIESAPFAQSPCLESIMRCIILVGKT